MANERRLHDSIWTDAYFQELDPDGKLLFIYLLTNEHIEVSGIYQLTVRTITNETGIAKQRALDLMEKLSTDNKIIYLDNVVGIINYHKHNRLINNPKYQVAIRNSLAKHGLAIQEEYCRRLGIDWVSIGYRGQSPNTNINTKINTKIKTNTNTNQPESTVKTEQATFSKASEARDQFLDQQGFSNWGTAELPIIIKNTEYNELEAKHGKETLVYAIREANRKQAVDMVLIKYPVPYIVSICNNRNGVKNGKCK